MTVAKITKSVVDKLGRGEMIWDHIAVGLRRSTAKQTSALFGPINLCHDTLVILKDGIRDA
jgi:hypothetical protein